MWRSGVSRVLLLGALGACSGDSPVDPGPQDDISGAWAWSESVADATSSIACADTGEMVIAQTGASFTARGIQYGSCRVAGVEQFFTDSFQVTGGTISGTTLTFKVDPCPYNGSSNTASDGYAGSVTCQIPVENQSVNVAGAWSMRRGPPEVAGTVTLPAGDTLIVTGEAAGVTVDATGRRALKWLGYETSSPIAVRESVAVSGVASSAAFQVHAPIGFSGSVEVTVFARDVGDMLAERPTGHIVMLAGFARRPAKTLQLTGPVRDIAVNASGGRAYLPRRGPNGIAVVKHGERHTTRPPISTSYLPGGIDLTVGGDSLVIADIGAQRYRRGETW